MHIGLDFDNTIVSYDKLFYTVAMEQSLIPATLRQSKIAVREYLKRQGLENKWTELQGYVYGAWMDEASAYPGVLHFIMEAKQLDLKMSIVSHKTLHPVIGSEYNLPEAARHWIDQHLIDEHGRHLINHNDIYFEPTKCSKLSRITTIACTHFIDDLPDILADSDFPPSCTPILFDPEDHHHNNQYWHRYRSWTELSAWLQLIEINSMS